MVIIWFSCFRQTFRHHSTKNTWIDGFKEGKKFPLAIVGLEHHQFFFFLKEKSVDAEKNGQTFTWHRFAMVKSPCWFHRKHTIQCSFFRPSWMQINQRLPFVMINRMNDSRSLRETNWKNNTCAHYSINKTACNWHRIHFDFMLEHNRWESFNSLWWWCFASHRVVLLI